ncbi:MAG TPA: hypothetical protein VG757_13135 [Devosia sp.]|nr:hypothetical protein [Devosia sp.]
MTKTLALLAATALALLLSACAYDYLQHSDRIAYSAGDAVNANLEGETVNPSSKLMNDKSGLGKDGNVIPSEDEVVQ